MTILFKSPNEIRKFEQYTRTSGDPSIFFFIHKSNRLIYLWFTIVIMCERIFVLLYLPNIYFIIGSLSEIYAIIWGITRIDIMTKQLWSHFCEKIKLMDSSAKDHVIRYFFFNIYSAAMNILKISCFYFILN